MCVCVCVRTRQWLSGAPSVLRESGKEGWARNAKRRFVWKCVMEWAPICIEMVGLADGALSHSTMNQSVMAKNVTFYGR